MEMGGEVRSGRKAIAGAGMKKRGPGEREGKRANEFGSLTSARKANIFSIRKTTSDLRH